MRVRVSSLAYWAAFKNPRVITGVPPWIYNFAAKPLWSRGPAVALGQPLPHLIVKWCVWRVMAVRCTPSSLCGPGRELTHALLPDMQARGFGRIINLTGPDEPMTMNGGVPPNGAVHLWSKALSRHVGANGITVNSIAPGRIHSEQVDQKLLPTPQAQQAWVAAHVPAGYIGEPEDLGALVCFLVSPLARYITGQVIHVDGGARRAAS